MGFGDLKPNTRTNAMWLAENWATVTVNLPPDLTHPENIRQWAREQQHTALLPADLSDIQAESIETTAAEQRELWRDVGEALLVGRKQNPSNKEFSKWCKENGFGDMDRRDRADAMWLTEHWSLLSNGTTTPGLSHPHRIRVWFNEQQHNQD